MKSSPTYRGRSGALLAGNMSMTINFAIIKGLLFVNGRGASIRQIIVHGSGVVDGLTVVNFTIR